MSAPSSTSSKGGIFSKLTSVAAFAAKTGVSIAQKGLGVGADAFHGVADTVGLREQVEEVERAAKRAAREAKNAAGRKFADANKAANKARRLATKALDFEDDDEALESADYELLLSAPGATEKLINPHGTHTQNFVVPANSAFVWKARVKKGDIGFSVREAKEGSDSYSEIEPTNKYRSESLIQGQLSPVGYSRNIVLVLDNSYSHILPKRVVYWAAVGEKVSLADDAVGAARTKEVIAAEEGPSD